MDLDLATADARITEHRTRVTHADRFGPLLSTGSATAASRRTSTVAVTAVGNLLRAVGAALRGVGDLAHDSRVGPRSNEHDLAALGVIWPTVAAYDDELAEEVRAARQRRLAARAITPLAPVPLAFGHGATTRKPRGSNSERLTRVGERLRVTPRSAVFGGIGQSGD